MTESIAVSSGKGGVGKTTIAVNVALTLAKNGNKTLLLDADLGMANAHLVLGVNPEKSLEKQISYLDGLSSIHVLTKLDEITVNSYDFSMYHDLNCKLGLLSGTNNIIDSIAFANSQILAQYMKEN